MKNELKISVSKITAAWAFSEAALGGLLHALHIPLTGLFVGGVAALFICLIAYYSENFEEVIRSTIIVLIVKGIVSPHTPLIAYFSVLGQGVIGYLIFKSIKNYKFSSLLFCTLTLTFFGFQKFIFLTAVFGNEFWTSVNVFTNYILKQFFTASNNSDINFSFIIIAAYGVVHFIAGVIIGITASKFPSKLVRLKESVGIIESQNPHEKINPELPQKKKKNKIKKYLSALFLILLLILSYTLPIENGREISGMFIMFGRSIVILLLWFLAAAPLLKKALTKFTSKKQNVYAGEIDNIVNSFPKFKKHATYSWKESKKYSGLKKIKMLFMLLFGLLLLDNNFE